MCKIGTTDTLTIGGYSPREGSPKYYTRRDYNRTDTYHCVSFVTVDVFESEHIRRRGSDSNN